MELFATSCFFHEIFPHLIYPRAQELHNWRGKRYRQRSHDSCPRESVCLRIGACYDSYPESERYRPSVFLVFSLHTRTYTKYIWQLELEKRLKRLQNDSTMDLIAFTKVDREAGAISLWLAYSSNITVCEALALSEGEINIKTSLSVFRESGKYRLAASRWRHAAEFWKEFLPHYFIRFLNLVTAGKEDVGSSIVFSIEINLRRAVSGAELKLLKHVLLRVSIKHLFRSAPSSPRWYWCGHSYSYAFGLELDTVLAKAQVKLSTYLTPQIVTGESNIGYHCEWDHYECA